MDCCCCFVVVCFFLFNFVWFPFLKKTGLALVKNQRSYLALEKVTPSLSWWIFVLVVVVGSVWLLLNCNLSCWLIVWAFSALEEMFGFPVLAL